MAQHDIAPGYLSELIFTALLLTHCTSATSTPASLLFFKYAKHASIFGLYTYYSFSQDFFSVGKKKILVMHFTYFSVGLVFFF